MYPIPGGATYCAVASLHLLNRVDSALSERQIERLSRWCLTQQQSGFQGRTNKSPNTSYSFWIGATLQVCKHFILLNRKPKACHLKFVIN